MKNLFLFSLVVFSQITYAANGVLLSYRYGNQIKKSELKIYQDGTVRHWEKYGGGEPLVEKEGSKLSPEIRKQLFDSIDAVSKAEEEVTEGKPTAMGSSSGELIAYSMNDKYIIRVIERGEPMQPGVLDKVTYNLAPEARWIEKLVYSFVENKMYR